MTQHVMRPAMKNGITDPYQKTGTTADAYADGVDLNCSLLKEVRVFLMNTDAANALTYQAFVSADPSSTYHETAVTEESTLAAGEDMTWNAYDLIGRFRISLKSTVGSSHATYEIQAKGQSV